MIHSNQIYIPIPKIRNTHCSVVIDGDDLTPQVIDSSWTKPCTNGVGTFNIKLSNSKGQISGTYNVGDSVKFYADNSDGTTLQFWGRIDYIKEEISDQGQYLNIDGRHISYLLNEYTVCYNATGKLTSQILKDLIDELPGSYGFTYTNIQTDTVTMDVEWNYKPFWDCVIELCNKAGFDCYVDDDLDVHYFLENSIANSEDAIVEGDNFIKTEYFGTNDYYEKTRVVVMGQDSGGLPIVYTAISPNEGDDIKELFLKVTDANTMEKVKNVAEAKLYEVTNRNPQSKMTSFGLETIKPGDNIWIIIPRQKIAAQYKLVQITHHFGMKSGGWRTETSTEEQDTGIASSIQNLNQVNQQITDSPNVNKFNYSYNFDFDTDLGEHNTTEITKSVLKTKNDGNTGTWISPIRELSADATKFEFRVVGENLSKTGYFVSTNGGTIWQLVAELRTQTDLSPIGTNLRIKIIFNSADAQVDSIALLYS